MRIQRNSTYKTQQTIWSRAGGRSMQLLLLSRFSRVWLCDPIDGSLPGPSVHGVLQARTLEWVAISFSNACMHAKLLQSCPAVCDPMDSNPPGSSVHGVLQARTLEWVAIAFSPSTLLPRYSKCGLLTNFNGILQSLLEMQNLESLARTTESELVF